SLRCLPLTTLLLSSFSPASSPQLSPLSLHDALPIWSSANSRRSPRWRRRCSPNAGGTGLPVERAAWTVRRERICSTVRDWRRRRSEEHTSELQSLRHLVCRLLLEKKKKRKKTTNKE